MILTTMGPRKGIVMSVRTTLTWARGFLQILQLGFEGDSSSKRFYCSEFPPKLHLPSTPLGGLLRFSDCKEDASLE